MTDVDTRELTPGDRRELRSLLKKQFGVLRNDVKRRESELRGEIEAELLTRYRQQDEHIEQAKRELEKAADDYRRAKEVIADSLRAVEPNLTVGWFHSMDLQANDPRRAQLRAALVASVPRRIADAYTRLDQQEIELLRELTVGALSSEQARRFLGAIPTVGELVPTARLTEIEGATT